MLVLLRDRAHLARLSPGPSLLPPVAAFHLPRPRSIPLRVHHIFSARSSVGGRLDCFHVLAIVNSGAGCMLVFELWFPLDIRQGVGLQDH